MKYQEIMRWIEGFEFDPNVQYTVMPLYEDMGEHSYKDIKTVNVDEEIMYRYTWDKNFMINNAVMPAVRNAIMNPDLYHSIEIYGRQQDADPDDQSLVFAIDIPITEVPEADDEIEHLFLSDGDAVWDWMDSYTLEFCTTYSVFAANDLGTEFSYSSLIAEDDEDRCILVNRDDIRDKEDLVGCINHSLSNLSPYFDHLFIYKVDISPAPEDLDENDPDVVLFHDGFGRTLGAKGTLALHIFMDIALMQGDEDEEEDM